MSGTHHTEASKCPECGKSLDTHESVDLVDQRAPEKDDLSVCIKCASWNMFNEDLSLRVMTEEDINQIDPETIAHMQRFSDEIKKMNDVNKS